MRKKESIDGQTGKYGCGKGGRGEPVLIFDINDLLNMHKVTDMIANDCENVNAKSIKEVYLATLAKYPEASVIQIISDNARYYRNKKLKEWLKGTKISKYSCLLIHRTSI